MHLSSTIIAISSRLCHDASIMQITINLNVKTIATIAVALAIGFAAGYLVADKDLLIDEYDAADAAMDAAEEETTIPASNDPAAAFETYERPDLKATDGTE